MVRRDDLMEALDAIETGMCKVKESRGIWQNDLVYALCQGVRMLLMEELRHGIPVEASSPAAAAEITPPRAGMDSGGADVAPIRHGHWNTGYFHDRVCSCCFHPDNDINDYAHSYCPNCGAKMDGGGGDAAD